MNKTQAIELFQYMVKAAVSVTGALPSDECDELRKEYADARKTILRVLRKARPEEFTDRKKPVRLRKP